MKPHFTRAAVVAALAACGPSAPPAPPPKAAPTTPEPPPVPPAMETIDPALDDIVGICKNAMTPDGDCLAPTALLCDAMERTAHACYDASLEAVRCNVLMDAVSDHVKARGLGASTARVVSTFCEATCEVRQAGHRWEAAKGSLDAVCSRGGRPVR